MYMYNSHVCIKWPHLYNKESKLKVKYHQYAAASVYYCKLHILTAPRTTFRNFGVSLYISSLGFRIRTKFIFCQTNVSTCAIYDFH